MSSTVSFILPVYNFQSALRERVGLVMEILAELADQFDVLIIDRGSTDETRDIALELMREYPQVDFLELAVQNSLYDAVELGIFRTSGAVIFVHDPSYPLGTSAMHRLWMMRDDEDLVMAQSRSSDVKPSVFASLISRQSPEASAPVSIQMIRRCALPEQRVSHNVASPAVERVTRTDLADAAGHAGRLPKLLSRRLGATERRPTKSITGQPNSLHRRPLDR